MSRKSPYKIILTAQEREILESDAARYTSPYYIVIRAKAILLASEDVENKEIGRRLDMKRQIVSKWRKRFFEQRLEGLKDNTRSGRPPLFPPRDHGRNKSSRM